MTDGLSKPVLTGKFLSPFVRRVAITLNYFDIEFDRQVLSAVNDVSEIEKSNPIGRVPALLLTDGSTLIDSAAILDYVDNLVGSERALIPAVGEARQRALFLLAIACGTIERSMVANAERRRPSEKQIEERLERLKKQTIQGIVALEKHLDTKEWYLGGKISQPDITTAVGITFINHIFPDLLPIDQLPNLVRLTRKCEDMPAFQAAQID